MRHPSTMLLALCLSITSGVFAQPPKPLDPPVFLPDGQSFLTWELPREVAKTYYVDGTSERASDGHPGTKDRPFKTIGRAAELLQPGERVVIGGGVYRERVRPRRGGTGPGAMISYEAAPGAEVVLRGSQVFETRWERTGFADEDESIRVWNSVLCGELFDEGNPFAEVNLTDEQIDRCMPWAVPIKGSMPFPLRRGLVFQDGRRLRQVATREELRQAQGVYWVEGSETIRLHVRLFADAEPGEATIEVTTRETVFAPDDYGLGYLRVFGLMIEQVGNRFPRPQLGAISTMRGHHWILEQNTVRQVNSIGIDIGDQFDVRGPELAEGGCHIVRANTITDCGIGGLEGKQIENTLIEDNVIRRCGWQSILRIYETGGIKVHCTRNCLLRRNLVTDTIQAPGIWMDYTNVNSRCSQNRVIRADSSNGAIFMEASQEPNLVDHNVVWDSSGSGIYQHDCDELIIANNFVGKCADSAIRMQICQGREVGGRLSTAKGNTIVGNLLYDAETMLSISDPDNTSDDNVFVAGRRAFDLEKWRGEHGWDAHSVCPTAEGTWDQQTFVLRWDSDGPWLELARPAVLTHDLWGRVYKGDSIPAGPFGMAAPAGEVLFDWDRVPGDG